MPRKNGKALPSQGCNQEDLSWGFRQRCWRNGAGNMLVKRGRDGAFIVKYGRDGAFIVKYGRDGACTVSTLIFQDFFREELQLHAGLAEHLLRLGAGMVLFLAHDAGDAAVDDEHGADTAGGHTAI